MRIAIICAAFALAACGGAEDETLPEPDATAERSETPEIIENAEEVPVEPEAVAPELTKLSGKNCYFSQTEQVTEALEVTFAEDGGIAGFHYGTIHDDANAYYAAFDVDLSNGQAMPDGSVQFDSVIEVDGDTQTETAVWTFTEELATTSVNQLSAADCEGLMDRVRPPIE